MHLLRTFSLLLVAQSLSLTTPSIAEERARPLDWPIERVTLDNGLRVVLARDTTSPTVAVAVTYDVGSRNEEPGRSGFAHLFEHMMFQGSANVPKGEHFKLVVSRGGTLNGTTSSDRTNYYQILPSSELALALWLEADRMKSLDVSVENFENQRKVVQEEYRMRVANAAYVPARIRLSELAYEGYWPYSHPAIGSMKDLDEARIEWVRSFHEAYYAPNLAVLTIAGDFDSTEALDLVQRYFGPAKRQEMPIAFDPPAFAEPDGPRKDVVFDRHAKTPGFYYGWVVPKAREPEHYALQMAARILTDGESSRLHRLLVRDRAVATEVRAGMGQRRGPDLFTIFVKLTENANIDEVRALVDAELRALAEMGPTQAEMRKAQSRTEAAYLFGLQSNLNRATRLGEYELFHGDARLLLEEPVRFAQVSADDVREAVGKWLAMERRTLVEAHPVPKAAESED